MGGRDSDSSVGPGHFSSSRRGFNFSSLISFSEIFFVSLFVSLVYFILIFILLIHLCALSFLLSL